uniref:Cytochrome c oxidase subunit 3 n=1 Tax=Asymmetron inferum TaxID=426587 RepID=A7X7B8_9BRAN|nr:cytochrome c oxidase subunit III [Asymmetron inferum]BAF76598.1 cytochrome c oxidase subunit 3 [Asymmetron inferum]
MTGYQTHPWHLVEPSPWPFVGGSAAFTLTVGMIMWFHYNSTLLLTLGLILVVVTMIQWWRDVVREATFQGCHTSYVIAGLRRGMVLFILSEVFFFLAFFWAFFHSSLAPTVELGVTWPPVGIHPLNAFAVPLLNTAVLLSSGVTVTWAHHALMDGNRTESIQALAFTVMLGLYFSGLQAWEYYEAPFTIADGIYGSTFFVATGFHGLHVIIGSTFLLVCLIRQILYHYTSSHHFGFEAAAWYWHFVDVVWLFLYVCIYWWGS